MEKFETHHTKGPWALGAYDASRIGNFEINNTFGDYVAETVGGLPDGVEEANAKLIAAAPLLLSALLNAMEHAEQFKDMVDHQNPDDEPYPLPEWYNEAKAAIAAAGVTVKTVEDGKA